MSSLTQPLQIRLSEPEVAALETGTRPVSRQIPSPSTKVNLAIEIARTIGGGITLGVDTRGASPEVAKSMSAASLDDFLLGIWPVTFTHPNVVETAEIWFWAVKRTLQLPRGRETVMAAFAPGDFMTVAPDDAPSTNRTITLYRDDKPDKSVGIADQQVAAYVIGPYTLDLKRAPHRRPASPSMPRSRPYDVWL